MKLSTSLSGRAAHGSALMLVRCYQKRRFYCKGLSPRHFRAGPMESICLCEWISRYLEGLTPQEARLFSGSCVSSQSIYQAVQKFLMFALKSNEVYAPLPETGHQRLVK